MSKLLEIKNITKHYINQENVSKGIHDISLSFEVNEFVCLTGSSGSGKTTLLNILGGLAKPDEGEIYYEGEFIDYLQTSKIETYRNNYISFIFQEYKLIPSMSVLDNVLIPLQFNSEKYSKARLKAKEIISRVGLSHRINKKVRTLSGGEQQRVVIARAIARNSKIIICDEPTGNLDKATGQSIIELLKEIARDKLVIFVTHNESELANVMTRKIVLNDGAVLTDEVVSPSNENLEATTPLQENHRTKKSSSLLRLIFKYFFSNPSTALLLILVFSIFGFLLLSSIGILKSSDSALFLDTTNQTVIDKNSIKVKRFDKTPLSDTEIENIKNKTHSKVLPYGFFWSRSFSILLDGVIDQKIQFFLESHFPSLPVSKGRKMSAPNECYFVVANPETSSELIGKTISFSDEFYFLDKPTSNTEFTIVGLIQKSSLPNNIIASNNQFAIIGESFIQTNPHFLSFKYFSSNILEFQLFTKQTTNLPEQTINISYSQLRDYVFVINNNPLQKKELHFYQTFIPDAEKNTEVVYNTEELKNVSFTLRSERNFFRPGLSNLTEFTFDLPNSYVYKRIKQSDAVSLLSDLKIKKPDEADNTNLIIIGQDLATEIMDNIAHQEVYFSSTRSQSNFLTLINDHPDYVYGVSVYKDPFKQKDGFFNLADYFIKVILVIATGISTLIYSLIISLIFKRIYQVKQKDYNILRTLGASKKNIITFIFVENLIVMHISFIIFLVTSLVLRFSLQTLPKISDIFTFSVVNYLVFYLLLLFMSAYSSFKYVTRLYKSEIARSLAKGGSKK